MPAFSPIKEAAAARRGVHAAPDRNDGTGVFSPGQDLVARFEHFAKSHMNARGDGGVFHPLRLRECGSMRAEE